MCGGPAWKREVVPDHKFDFVDIRDFTDHGIGMRLKYLWIYLVVLKSFLVYVSDIFTAVTMLSTNTLSTQIIPSDCEGLSGCVFVPFNVTKWLFVGCIIFSFLLLAYESRKAKKIIASRDISYAFTNVMANNYYSIRSYDHFCFFEHISDSTTKKDDFALFVFFTFKSWKRLLLADGPRQVINALTLWALFISKSKEPGNWYDVQKYFPDGQKISISALTVTTFFTVLVFIGSMLLLTTAAILYIPLLCYIRGNLKEYVCHKVDKRISQIIKRRNKERLAKANELAKKEAMGDYSHLKNKKGELIAKPLPQPTLPNLSVDDDMDDSSTMHTRVPPSNYSQDNYFASDYKNDLDYPPMPTYQQGYGHQGHSQSTFNDPAQYGQYEEEYEGTAHLTGAAAPVGSSQPLPDHGQSNAYGYYSADPHGTYQGQADSDWRTPGHVQQHVSNVSGESQNGVSYGADYTTPAHTAHANHVPTQSLEDAYGGTTYHHQGGMDHAHQWQGGSSGYAR